MLPQLLQLLLLFILRGVALSRAAILQQIIFEMLLQSQRPCLFVEADHSSVAFLFDLVGSLLVRLLLEMVSRELLTMCLIIYRHSVGHAIVLLVVEVRLVQVTIGQFLLAIEVLVRFVCNLILIKRLF